MRRRQHLLEVVEHQHQLTVRQRTSQCDRRVVPARLSHLERPGDGRSHLVGFRDARQVDEDRTVAQLVADASCHLDGEPCLADASRSGDRHQAHVAGAQQGGHVLDLVLAAQQRRARRRNVDHHPTIVHGRNTQHLFQRRSTRLPPGRWPRRWRHAVDRRTSQAEPGGRAMSKRNPLQPSPSPTRLRRPIHSAVPPSGVRASW